MLAPHDLAITDPTAFLIALSITATVAITDCKSGADRESASPAPPDASAVALPLHAKSQRVQPPGVALVAYSGASGLPDECDDIVIQGPDFPVDANAEPLIEAVHATRPQMRRVAGPCVVQFHYPILATCRRVASCARDLVDGAPCNILETRRYYDPEGLRAHSSEYMQLCAGQWLQVPEDSPVFREAIEARALGGESPPG